jgi:4-amino-4-deoxy-L-arabinose transferase-like glycosyltransferase
MTKIKTALSRLSEKRNLHIIILLIISSALILYNLGGNSFHDSDEALFAIIVKEMIRTGDWLTPHVGDEIAYTKPPLIFWLSALSSSAFGFSEFSVRFPSAIFGILTVVLTYLFAESLYNRGTALLASLMILTCSHFIYVHSSKTGELDTATTFFILLSTYSIWKSKQEKKYFYLVFASIGLVFMTKALAFIIPMGIVILYLLLSRRIKDFSIGQWTAGFGIFILISLPWHIHQLITHHGTFVDLYLRDQIIGRRMGPGISSAFLPLYYIKIILSGFFPWSLILPFAFIYNIIYSFKKKAAIEQTSLILIYAFVIYLISNIIPIKYNWYIMPIYPALAILSGRFFLNYLKDIMGSRIFSFGLAGVLLFLIIIIPDFNFNPFITPAYKGLMKLHFNNTFLSFYHKSPDGTILFFLLAWFLMGMATHAMLNKIEKKMPGSSKAIIYTFSICLVAISFILIVLPLRFSNHKSFFYNMNNEIWYKEDPEKVLILYGNNMPYIEDYIYLYNFKDPHRRTAKFIELNDDALLQEFSSTHKNMFLMERQHYYDIRHKDSFKTLLPSPIREWNNYVLLDKQAGKSSWSGGSEQVLENIKNLQDSNLKIRIESAQRLGSIGDRAAVPPLITLLDDPGNDVVAAAARALSDLRDPVAAGPLRKALTRYNEDGGTYQTIALALAYLRDKSSINFLLKNFKDNPLYLLKQSNIINPPGYSDHNRFWTAYLLLDIDPMVAREAILENLLDHVIKIQNSGGRLSSFSIRNQILYRVGTRHALDFIEQVLNDKDISKRKIALYLLTKPSGANAKMTSAEMERAQYLLRRTGEVDNSPEMRALSKKILEGYHKEAWVVW